MDHVDGVHRLRVERLVQYIHSLDFKLLHQAMDAGEQ